MTDLEMAEEYVDTLLRKDNDEVDKFLDENLGDLKLTEKQCGTLLGIIKGVGITSFIAGLKADVHTDNSKVIAELEKENAELKNQVSFLEDNLRVARKDEQIKELEKKNKELKEILIVGTTWNKGLISRNKALEEECDKYRNMVFDKIEQLTKSKKLLAKWVELFKPKSDTALPTPIQVETEQFLKEVENEEMAEEQIINKE
jgi:hypothetical protein